jgi:hypothetical protein
MWQEGASIKKRRFANVGTANESSRLPFKRVAGGTLALLFRRFGNWHFLVASTVHAA